MIGGIILDHCIRDNRIKEIVSLVRRPSGLSSPILKETIIENFLDFSACANEFQQIDVAYFCIGVYTGAVPDEQFKVITVDYVKAFADKLKNESPNATLSFLSGAGADLKEKSRISFARYKGMAENHLLKSEFKELYIFRPGYIYPVAKRAEPNTFYRIFRMLYPLFKLFGKNMSVKSTELGQAMFAVFKNKPPKQILENRDIRELV